MKDCNKKSLYLKYYNLNNLCEWMMSQKLPVNHFKWVEYISEINIGFMKSYNDERNK